MKPQMQPYLSQATSPAITSPCEGPNLKCSHILARPPLQLLHHLVRAQKSFSIGHLSIAATLWCSKRVFQATSLLQPPLWGSKRVFQVTSLLQPPCGAPKEFFNRIIRPPDLSITASFVGVSMDYHFAQSQSATTISMSHECLTNGIHLIRAVHAFS